MASLTERVQALPQFQGRAWETIDPREIQAALQRLMSEDQAAYDASKRRWGVADKAAMGTVLSLLGMGVGSAFGGGAAASAGGPSFSAGGSLPAIEGGAPWAVTPYAAPVAATGTGIGAGVGAGVGAGAGGAAGRGLLGGLSARDLAAIGLAGAGTIGGALSSKPNMAPNTMTQDPNLQRLLQTMQGRLDKSEPLYDSIMSMANGLLPTQYQKGGGGMG